MAEKIGIKQEIAENQFDDNPSDVSSSEDDTQDSVLTHNSITSGSFDSDSEKEIKSKLKTPKEQKMLITSPGEADVKTPKKDINTYMNPILRDARFFLMKSNNEDNVEISKSRSVWSTPPGNEAKINQAMRETQNVILIFSVKESGQFSGFARVAGSSRQGGEAVPWILPPGLSSRTLGSIFDLDWISKKDLSFNKTQHLFNPWNEGKPVKIGRDGQEIEPHVAAELCRLFPADTTTNWNKLSSRIKNTISTRIGRITAPIGSNSNNSFNPGLRGRGFANRRMISRGRFVPQVQHNTRSFDFGRGRKRSFEEDFSGGGFNSMPKRSRGSYDSYAGGYNDAPPERYYQEPPPVYNPPRKMSSRFPDYNPREYHQPPPMPPMPYPPPAPFDSLPPLPRYYDVPPLPEFPPSSSRLIRDRRSSSPYEKSVSDFIRRADDRAHREHNRDRKYYRH